MLENIKFDNNGLIPVIAQDFISNKILMLAYANKESLEYTIKTNKATYWSRSRQKIWCKGEQSGNFQEIKDILIDCDADAIIYKVEQHGNKAACHTGHQSCFYRHLVNNIWVDNDEPILFDPKKIYNLE